VLDCGDAADMAKLADTAPHPSAEVAHDPSERNVAEQTTSPVDRSSAFPPGWNGQSRTPLMGWRSWNAFGNDIDQALMGAHVDALVAPPSAARRNATSRRSLAGGSLRRRLENRTPSTT